MTPNPAAPMALSKLPDHNPSPNLRPAAEPGDKIVRTEDRGLGYETTEVTYATNPVQKDAGKTSKP